MRNANTLIYEKKKRNEFTVSICSFLTYFSLDRNKTSHSRLVDYLYNCGSDGSENVCDCKYSFADR